MQRPSTLQLEQAFLDSWPALETEQDGGWIWRYADGYTKRANCAQSMDPTDAGAPDEHIARYTGWAQERGIDPIFRVTPLANEQVIASLNKAGWQSFETSLVMAMPVGVAFSPKHRFVTLSADDAAWQDVQARMSGYGKQTTHALKGMLSRMAKTSRGILVLDANDEPAAAALVNNCNGIGVYHNVVVREKSRGEGFGRSVMQAALNWSREEGAGWAGIQVVGDNVPAISLYKSLGFNEIYRYHYRRPILE